MSYNTVTLRDEGGRQPKVGTFNWDFAAPSYLGPLTQWHGPKPKSGFVVCDVLLGVNVSANELRPFINKCNTLRSLQKVGRCLQVFVADGYEPDALGLAKKTGVVPATTETLFGFEVAKALRQLADILKEVYPRDRTFEKVDEVFSRLRHIEGAANNVRGALFEFVAAEVVRICSPHTSIQLNEILRDDQGKSAEIDVLVHHINHSVRFIECKGYKPGGTVPDDMVRRWLQDRIPLIRKVAKSDQLWRHCRTEFEFWTSGQLSAEATAMVQAEAATLRRSSLKVFQSQEVGEMVKNTNNHALKRTYGEHFLEHPLEQAERAAKKPNRRLPIPPRSELTKREASEEGTYAFERYGPEGPYEDAIRPSQE